MNPFLPLYPFILHPERIAAVACLFAIAAAWIYFLRRKIPWMVISAAGAWASFAAWEWYCKIQAYNIRVDLFLIFPVLLAITVGGVVRTVAAAMGSTSPYHFSLRTLLVAMTLVAVFFGLISMLTR